MIAVASGFFEALDTTIQAQTSFQYYKLLQDGYFNPVF
jgi:hypothetical protein